MTFGSLFFLTAFLPPVLIVHAALQGGGSRRRTAAANAWLLACSLAAIFLSDLPGLKWFVGCAAWTDLATRCVSAALRRGRQRTASAALALAVTADMALLCAFKWLSSSSAGAGADAASAIAIPLGLSFWTFRAVSLVWDVRRGVHPPPPTPLHTLGFMALFPVYVSGPVVRWSEIGGAFERRPFDVDLAASGMRRLAIGLAKKALLADNLAPFADAVWALADQGLGVPCGMAALAVPAYSLRLYFDFSGYSDMAIGMGRMLGFRIPENFLWPYAARSVREFWRRWHVSLSSWFRDYLYIPLGGSRRGAARACINGLVVFTLCGVWHGNGLMFALWGFWHGLLICVERLVAPSPSQRAARREPTAGAAESLVSIALSRVWLLAAVAFGWLLFRSATPATAFSMIRSLVGLAQPSAESRALWLECTPVFTAAFAAGAVLCFPVAPALVRLARRVLPGWAVLLAKNAAATALACAALFFMVSGTRQSFLYFQF